MTSTRALAAWGRWADRPKPARCCPAPSLRLWEPSLNPASVSSSTIPEMAGELRGAGGWGVRPHLHTYSSSGGWVLGVMIQGAMRKTTVSVKMGTSGRV